MKVESLIICTVFEERTSKESKSKRKFISSDLISLHSVLAINILTFRSAEFRMRNSFFSLSQLLLCVAINVIKLCKKGSSFPARSFSKQQHFVVALLKWFCVIFFSTLHDYIRVFFHLRLYLFEFLLCQTIPLKVTRFCGGHSQSYLNRLQPMRQTTWPQVDARWNGHFSAQENHSIHLNIWNFPVRNESNWKSSSEFNSNSESNSNSGSKSNLESISTSNDCYKTIKMFEQLQPVAGNPSCSSTWGNFRANNIQYK